VVLVLQSCVSYSPPDFLASEYSAKEVGRIHVLPVADLRMNPSVRVDRAVIDAEMATDFTGTGDLTSLLDSRGYDETSFVDPSTSRVVEWNDLVHPTEAWIAEIGPADARWVLLIALEDLAVSGGVGYVTVKCSGHLFDRQLRKPVWGHRTRLDYGGPVSPGLRANDVPHTLNLCVRRLIEHFPPRD
jgi:hypothetical protein